MHRVRQGLPYFKSFGWEPTVLCVKPKHVEMATDSLLNESIPKAVRVIKVNAFSTKYTRKLGLGNLGLRAFWQLYRKGNMLLRSENFDLVYFSTTMFACMPIGRLWKRKFNVPFIIDMQDPWRNDYYLTVPKSEQPPKFWFAHRLNSTLEKFTIPHVNGIVSVSQGYIDILKERYPSIQKIPSKVLTFGAAVKDFELIQDLKIPQTLIFDTNKTNIVYVGRGGHDMKQSLSLVFKAFKNGLEQHPQFKNCKLWFIGTSYAPDGQGKKTIVPLAETYGVEKYIEEITDRKSYFEVLSLLKKSDVILIPGSEDKNYTASKLYPNILAKKPLLCIFHSNSSVVSIVKKLNAGHVVEFDKANALQECEKAILSLINNHELVPKTNWNYFDTFTAKTMTKAQCDFFETVISTN
ncbi:glycosyltransferase [uncultured Psychroserpens sp.]|uniref:glycosyltransferase n=1 Tax=uncultured Psychroserpens sp. TaxID=255436 RepID=UPI002610B022|nr:glycosyltransferase [uncultured Psychroserpens sp.]